MKKIITALSILVLILVVTLIFAPMSQGAEYVVKPGDNLTKIANVTGYRIANLVLMNEIKNPDHIRVGQIITYVGTDDILRARVWAENRRSELNSSNDNYKYFGWVLEDLMRNRIRYSLDGQGTHFRSILEFSKAQGKACRVMWRSNITAHEGHGDWMDEKIATERMKAHEGPEIHHWLECR